MKKLTNENYTHCFFRFRDRQAGVAEIFDPLANLFYYNSYCLEQKILKEIYSAEFAFLEDALVHTNSEFGNWEFQDITLKKSECSSCQNHS